mmetsp:Transcript_25978/g.66871  ORF Transcript_25978/g.66871 Transcript_25978/m.66871 type:complete len:251 (+) Transcript_25978:337-1089(+)
MGACRGLVRPCERRLAGAAGGGCRGAATAAILRGGGAVFHTVNGSVRLARLQPPHLARQLADLVLRFAHQPRRPLRGAEGLCQQVAKERRAQEQAGALVVLLEDLDKAGVREHRPVHEQQQVAVQVHVLLVHTLEVVQAVGRAQLGVLQATQVDDALLLLLQEHVVEALHVFDQRLQKARLLRRQLRAGRRAALHLLRRRRLYDGLSSARICDSGRWRRRHGVAGAGLGSGAGQAAARAVRFAALLVAAD